MRVLAIHAGSVRIEADTGLGVDSRIEAADPDAGDEVYAIDGAIVAVVGVEVGDRSGTELVARAARADLERMATDLGAETIVLVAATHDETGLTGSPAAVLGALDDALSVPSIFVPERSYPELLSEGTVHPTAVRFRRYDGWLPATFSPGAVLDEDRPTSGSRPTSGERSGTETSGTDGTERTSPSWATRRETPAETLRKAGLLVDREQGASTWTPGGAFLRDTLRSRVRDYALEAGAHPTGVRDRSGGPPSCPSTTNAGTIQYAVRTLSGGVRPELAVRVMEDAALAKRGDDLAAMLERTRATFERSRRTLLATDETLDRTSLPDVLEERLDPERTVESVLPDPVRLAVTVGIETDDGRHVRPVGTLVAARLEESWVLQCAPLGRLDRTMAALLEGSRPILPPSIAPTQLRLLPIDDAQLGTCERFVETLAEAGVRVDVDDRRLPVGERITTARSEGVPYYAVVGDREAESGELAVTDRRVASEHALSPQETIAEHPTLGEADARRHYGPRFISERNAERHGSKTDR